MCGIAGYTHFRRRPDRARIWEATKALQTITDSVLEGIPPTKQIKLTAETAHFYQDEVANILNSSTGSMMASARSLAFGSVDDVQTLYDEAEALPIKVNKDVLEQLTGAPLHLFIEDKK